MRISNYYSSYLFKKKNAHTPKNYFLRSDYFEKTLTSRCGCCDFDESVRVMDGVGVGDGRGCAGDGKHLKGDMHKPHRNPHN